MTDRQADLALVADTVEARGRAVRRFPGNMLPETVVRIESDCLKAGRVLRFIAAHDDGLRALIGWLKANPERVIALDDPSAIDPLEAQMLREHPAVAPLLAAFPSAGISVVRPIPQPSADAELDKQDDHND